VVISCLTICRSLHEPISAGHGALDAAIDLCRRRTAHPLCSSVHYFVISAFQPMFPTQIRHQSRKLLERAPTFMPRRRQAREPDKHVGMACRKIGALRTRPTPSKPAYSAHSHCAAVFQGLFFIAHIRCPAYALVDGVHSCIPFFGSAHSIPDHIDYLRLKTFNLAALAL
jgi:hypothetical protein